MEADADDNLEPRQRCRKDPEDDVEEWGRGYTFWGNEDRPFVKMCRRIGWSAFQVQYIFIKILNNNTGEKKCI